jgi:hypothetical protein
MWLTPDDSLEDPAGTHSGLVVFDASPPEEWTFEDYNKCVPLSSLLPASRSTVTALLSMVHPFRYELNPEPIGTAHLCTLTASLSTVAASLSIVTASLSTMTVFQSTGKCPTAR